MWKPDLEAVQEMPVRDAGIIIILKKKPLKYASSSMVNPNDHISRLKLLDNYTGFFPSYKDQVG